MTIRKADKTTDYEKVWEIFSNVVKSGDTYAYDPATKKESLQQLWFGDNMDTFVVVDEHDNVIGTYFMKPNQPGLGSHIANCGYMVHPLHHGKGIGQLLGEHSIRYGRERGYRGIQFNFVVSTNVVAVRLWQKLGFNIIGTTPLGFRHRELGFVDTYIMFMQL